MKPLKRPIRLASLSLLLSSLLLAAACGNEGSQPPGGANAAEEGNTAAKVEEEQRINVVTSFYPLYFLATEIGGDHVSVDNLIASGVEPHEWTPKSRDLSVASNAQLFLYHGAGLEGWVDDFLTGLSKDSKVVSKEASLGVPLIEGFEEGEEEHAEEGHAHEEEGHEHEEEGHDHGNLDPHTWVSPKSALVLAENVKNSLIEVDAANKADYEKNFEAVKRKLGEIDSDYTEQLAGTANKNIVVSHQAFGYLARDYGLNQIAIMGLSPEAEPRAQDLLDIARFVKENEVKYIFFEELVSDQLAKTLAAEADVDTMVLNPLEGLTSEQEAAGDNYFTLMERNLQNLVQALQ
ncbi:metal ABC transporter solute-binding protein, Zn/Mn family [Paenibacillus arenilitoris]|uniref:Zinc ABC transporter substrate-binding protein n=1 Tax=Paenibacillus arenilitoris TaxID=2772299 RepID=A0A927CPF0_9BACL|nr:zinc ABC transporter substrate-binding protein [Paenibacillus arenilitoris]MBD2869531.1 zinc ABC transporter substrate-binding protein [Paenibacillus arenilitoris]